MYCWSTTGSRSPLSSVSNTCTRTAHGITVGAAHTLSTEARCQVWQRHMQLDLACAKFPAVVMLIEQRLTADAVNTVLMPE